MTTPLRGCVADPGTSKMDGAGAAIEISPLEVLALKKLVLINHALAQALKDRSARSEQVALVSVLNGVTVRADLANRAVLSKPERR